METARHDLLATPSPAPSRLPRIAELIEQLDPAEVARGLWRDELLTLGGRLRPIYGTDVGVDLEAGGYTVPVGMATVVTLTCSDAAAGDVVTVRVACTIHTPAPVAPARLRFALRESPRLLPARIVREDGGLVAVCELPFASAHGTVIQRAVSAVALAARKLRGELDATRSVDWHRVA